MRIEHLGPREFARQPWRNGGGFTTELAREGEGERFLWRASIAEVERAGPFSDFAGYDRTLMLLEGEGLELDFGPHGRRRIDRPHVPVAFDGGWKTGCRLLGGPVRDLNLIVDRARARGSIAVVPAYGGKEFTLAAAWVLLYCLQGSTRVEVAGAEHELHAGELLRLDEPGGAPAALHEGQPGSLVADIRIVRS